MPQIVYKLCLLDHHVPGCVLVCIVLSKLSIHLIQRVQIWQVIKVEKALLKFIKVEPTFLMSICLSNSNLYFLLKLFKIDLLTSFRNLLDFTRLFISFSAISLCWNLSLTPRLWNITSSFLTVFLFLCAKVFIGLWGCCFYGSWYIRIIMRVV